MEGKKTTMAKRRRLQIGSAGISLKLILLGDGGVGKTTLVKSWMDQTLRSDYLMTVGVDISVKEFILEDGNRVKLTVSDIAGQELFAQFRSIFFGGANLAFLVFDVTRRESLDNLETEWLPQLLPTLSDPKFSLGLIANKVDLSAQRQIQRSEVQLAYKRLKKRFPMIRWIGYLETSALTKHNVQLAFHKISTEYFSSSKEDLGDM